MKKCLYFILFLSFSYAKGQDTTVIHVFHSLEQLIDFSEETSLDLIVDNIRVTQARTYQRTAKLGVFNPTINLPNNFTYNTSLPVTLLPAEVFGGEPGTNVQLRVGVPYTTELTQSLEVQLLNAGGWADYQLAKLNAEITASNGQLNRQTLQENLADSYYTIVSLQKQLASTTESLKSADSIYLVTQNKFQEGQVSQQDLNNAAVNQLNTESSLKQIAYMLTDAYLTLKALCNIPDIEQVTIDHRQPTIPGQTSIPAVALNHLQIKHELMNQAYAFQQYAKSKTSFYPTLAFKAGNTFQLNNDTFRPFSGDWITSNYIGLSLNVNLSFSSQISNLQQAKLDYEIATEQLAIVRQSAEIEQKRLANNYADAQSEFEIAEKIRLLNVDTYQKNLNLYTAGLISVDNLLDSYEAMVNATYTTNAAEISLELAYAKILINNQFN